LTGKGISGKLPIRHWTFSENLFSPTVDLLIIIKSLPLAGYKPLPFPVHPY